MENFPNAPITEALVDIKVQLPSEVTPARLESLHSLIQKDYPEKKPRRMWQVEFKGDAPGGAEPRDLGIDGYQFISADGKQVVQFRLDGFTFSRLKPYESWEKMYGEMLRLWSIYREQCKPSLVTRVATRYINAIEIPTSRFVLEDYFTAPPKVPEGLPENVGEFFSRLVILYPGESVRAIVTLALAQATSPTSTPVLLDIDTFTEVKLAPEDQRVAETLTKIRDIKNDIFSKSVTEKAKVLFR